MDDHDDDNFTTIYMLNYMMESTPVKIKFDHVTEERYLF